MSQCDTDETPFLDRIWNYAMVVWFLLVSIKKQPQAPQIYIIKKPSSETNKLPPSLGALTQHVKRACCPLIVWASANEVETREVDPLSFGWELRYGALMPITTEDEIALFLFRNVFTKSQVLRFLFQIW